MALNRSSYVVSLNVIRRCSQRLYSASTELKVSRENDQQEITVPYRIQRSPTDILKALSSTLKKDYTAANYKYVDDPYFIPASNVTKRAFALSKESGKKAARYFLEKYPELFKCNKSNPVIEAFEPPVTYTENDDVTEEILQSCIDSVDVANCITVYQLLTDKGTSLKPATQQQLLELLCFYNSTVPPRDDYFEEKWFSKKEIKRRTNTWLDSGLAEKLFQDMEKDSASYCAMILGTAKYGHAEKAFFLYSELRSKDLRASLETYNSLLSVVTQMKEDGDMRWETAMELVNHMNLDGIKPDLYTMNALLSIIADSRRWSKARSIAAQTVAEMRRLSIEPSLASYYYLLVIFYQNTRRFVSILPQIMDELDGRELEIRHPHDVNFFFTAMEVCNKMEYNKALAHRIHALLELGNNCKFLGCAFFESLYFQNYFKLLVNAEEFDKFMEIYERFVPNTYTPEPSVMFEIISALEFNGAYSYLPKIFSDVVIFEQTEREQILTELLRIAGSIKLDQQAQETVINFVWTIMEKIDKRAENNMRKTLQWTGLMFGDILKICLNGNDLEKSWVIMQRLQKEEFSLIGYPEVDSLIAFCKAFLEVKDFEKVDFCVKYAFASGIKIKAELEKAVNDLFDKKVLEEKDRPEIDAILMKIIEEKDSKDSEKNLQESEING